MREKFYRSVVVCIVPIFSAILGCAEPGPERATVRGTVTIDDAPLAQGSILFIPAAGSKGIAAGGQITDGKYELTGDAAVSLGTNRVEIRAVRKSGRKEQKPFAPPGVLVEVDEEAVASEFNANSTQSVDVKAGDQTFDFAVKSAPKS